MEQAVCAEQHCVAPPLKSALALLGMNMGSSVAVLLTFLYAILARQLHIPL